MAWLMEGLLYQDPRPQEFCLPGHSRVREWPHGAIPGQGLHLFQVTRVLANAVHPEAAAVRAAEGKGNLGPEGRGRAAWGTSSWTSQAVLEEDRAPMPPEYPTCLGTRVWAGGTLRPTPKPRSPLQGEPPLSLLHHQPVRPVPLLPPNLSTQPQLPQRANTCLGRLVPKAETCPCSLGPPPLSPLVTGSPRTPASGLQRPVDIQNIPAIPKRPMDRTVG